MRILIADDEFLVRMGIRHSIEKENGGFVIVGEASNGREAVRMAESLNPDIVLLDINMPVMNGIEVLKEYKRLGISARVVILSCHDEFEYVKQGMKLGAHDYILKHTVLNEKLYEVLDQLRGIILSRQRNAEFDNVIYDNIEEVREIVKHDYLKELISGKRISGSIPVHFGFDEKQFICILCSIEEYDKVKSRYHESECEDFICTFTSLIRQGTKKNENVEICCLAENKYVIIITPGCTSEGQKIEWSRSLASTVVQLAEKYMEIKISVGISRCKHSLEGLADAYNEASIALLSKYVDYRQKIFIYDLTPQQEQETMVTEYAMDLEQYIREAVVEGNMVKAESLFEEYFEHLREIRFVNRPRLIDFIQNMVAVMQTKRNVINEQVKEDIGEAKCLDEVSVHLHNFLESLKNPGFQDNFFTVRVRDYVAEHYAESLSLKNLADYFELSEGYVSRLFSKSMGMSFTRYLNQVRIDQSKELLLKSNRKVYEIAEECGFNSVVNFNIVFKKVEGISPIEFKNSFKL